MDPIVEIEIVGMTKSEYEIEATEEIIILGKEKEKSGLNDKLLDSNEKVKLNVLYNENEEGISETKKEKYKEINVLKKEAEIQKEKIKNIFGKIIQLENELNEEK